MSDKNREFLSQRVRSIKQSPSNFLAQRAAEMRAQGHDVISFAQGEPDFPTPEHIKQAAVEAMRRDFTHYTVVDGIPELKQAIRH